MAKGGGRWGGSRNARWLLTHATGCLQGGIPLVAQGRRLPAAAPCRRYWQIFSPDFIRHHVRGQRVQLTGQRPELGSKADIAHHVFIFFVSPDLHNQQLQRQNKQPQRQQARQKQSRRTCRRWLSRPAAAPPRLTTPPPPPQKQFKGLRLRYGKARNDAPPWLSSGGAPERTPDRASLRYPLPFYFARPPPHPVLRHLRKGQFHLGRADHGCLGRLVSPRSGKIYRAAKELISAVCASRGS